MLQQGRQGKPRHGFCTFQAELVAPAQHNPCIEREGRTNGVRKLLAALSAETGKFRGKNLKRRLTQLLAKGQPAFGQHGMANELPGSDTQRHDAVENVGNIADQRVDPLGKRLAGRRPRCNNNVVTDAIHYSYEK